MSDIINSKCDHCGKEVSDYSTEKGWIHFDLHGSNDEPEAFTLTLITDFNGYGNGRSTYIGHDVGSDLDFCSLDCFSKWLLKGVTRTRSG